MSRYIALLALASTAFAVPAPSPVPGTSAASIGSSLSGAFNRRLAKRQSVSGTLTGLTDFIQQVVAGQSSGECQSECAPWISVVTDCVNENTSNEAVGYCACETNTVRAMDTCGDCFDQDDFIDDFDSLCSSLGSGYGTGSGGSSASASASRSSGALSSRTSGFASGSSSGSSRPTASSISRASSATSTDDDETSTTVTSTSTGPDGTSTVTSTSAGSAAGAPSASPTGAAMRTQGVAGVTAFFAVLAGFLIA